MFDNGMQVLLGTPAELSAQITKDKQTWGELIRRAGLQAEGA
jgi:tripartite-type tricarboxylate transporter receptor subunit TctC